MKILADKIRENGIQSFDDLITLYVSYGFTTEFLKEIDAIT